MAANNSMLMHPAAAALNGAARLAHRGAQPKLMADAADTFLVFNAWMDKEQGFGPNGEVGILEEEVSSVLANAVRPGDGAVDAAGNSPGVFLHGLDAARWQQVWDQLLADGFDSSVPAATKGDALVAIRAFVDTNGAGHAAYQPVAGDWYALEGPGGAGAQHFARYFSWEECCDERGAARWASVLQSYTRGWATAVSRQGAGTYTVAPVLDGMWAEAQASGPAMRTGVAGVARADAVLAWLRDSVPPAGLSEWLAERVGTFRQRTVAELELRSTLAGADVTRLRAALGAHAALAVASHPPLEKVFDPIPAPHEFLSGVDGLLSALHSGEPGGPRRLAAYSDLGDLARTLIAGEYVPVIKAERARLAALVPPQTASSSQLVEAVRADCAHARAAGAAAPKAGSGPKAGLADGELGVAPAHLDSTQASLLLRRFRGGTEQAWLQHLVALSSPPPGVPVGSPPGAAAMPVLPDPHRILGHCFTSEVLAVHRFATGKLAALPLPAFEHPAVSGAAAHLGAYAAEAVLTGDDGVVSTQLGTRLVLPRSMVQAGARHAWDEVAWEELCLLVEEALRPVKYSTRVPKGQEWTSEQRAEDLLLYGSRFVAAFGGGKASDRNSFATLVTEWRSYLRSGRSVGGEVLTDHVANARQFMLASLELAGHHGRSVMANSNPVGALATSFVPAGAAPFGDLDRHRAAQDGVVQMTSSFPALARALGVDTGLTPLGVQTASTLAVPGATEEKSRPGAGKPKPTISKSAKRKAALERGMARARTAKAVVRDGVLHRPDGTSVAVAVLAAQAGCGESDLCWEVVASSGFPAARLLNCPCLGQPGHESISSAAHKRPAGFGAALASVFQGQRQ